MKRAAELRAEANALKVGHRLKFAVGPTKCTCGARWPCSEWERSEELLRQAHQIETSR
jgi:hypothetical protein